MMPSDSADDVVLAFLLCSSSERRSCGGSLRAKTNESRDVFERVATRASCRGHIVGEAHTAKFHTFYVVK